ncbi:MAG TPA: hypothetical protein VIR27_13830, partial [Mycobacteriales bacterium]
MGPTGGADAGGSVGLADSVGGRLGGPVRRGVVGWTVVGVWRTVGRITRGRTVASSGGGVAAARWVGSVGDVETADPR